MWEKVWERNSYRMKFTIKIKALYSHSGGDEGIRTLERLHVTPLAGERLRPLGHVSTAA